MYGWAYRRLFSTIWQQVVQNIEDRPISQESLIYAQEHLLDFNRNLANYEAIFCYAGIWVNDTIRIDTLQHCMKHGPTDSSGETVIVALGCDPGLDDFIECLRSELSSLSTEADKFKLLSKEVSERLGGEGDENIIEKSEQHIKELKQRARSAVVRIGDLKWGVCRHRAILFKVRPSWYSRRTSSIYSKGIDVYLNRAKRHSKPHWAFEAPTLKSQVSNFSTLGPPAGLL